MEGIMEESDRVALDWLLAKVQKEGGAVGLSHNGSEWVVGCTMGQEAPDSPMAGAAAYGVGEDIHDALATVFRDFRVTD